MMYGEQLAVDEGNEFGDEYQADLDYIECVENGKEGYESDVEDPSDAEDDGANGGEFRFDFEVDDKNNYKCNKVKATIFPFILA